MKLYKITYKKKPVLVGRKVRCVGEKYVELAYWGGYGWKFMDFPNGKQAMVWLKEYKPHLLNN